MSKTEINYNSSTVTKANDSGAQARITSFELAWLDILLLSKYLVRMLTILSQFLIPTGKPSPAEQNLCKEPISTQKRYCWDLCPVSLATESADLLFSICHLVNPWCPRHFNSGGSWRWSCCFSECWKCFKRFEETRQVLPYKKRYLKNIKHIEFVGYLSVSFFKMNPGGY